MKTLKKWRKILLYRRIMKVLLKNDNYQSRDPFFLKEWAKKYVYYYFNDVWQ